MASHTPFQPWRAIASCAYSEQEGVKRQWPANAGEIRRWYARIRRSAIAHAGPTTNPRPPNRQQQEQRLGSAAQAEVLQQQMRQLGHGKDIDEIEE